MNVSPAPVAAGGLIARAGVCCVVERKLLKACEIMLTLILSQHLYDSCEKLSFRP